MQELFIKNFEFSSSIVGWLDTVLVNVFFTREGVTDEEEEGRV